MALCAALFARRSSGQQRAASIEKQFRIYHEYAKRVGRTIAGVYTDIAISGESVIQRFGVRAPHEDSRRALFEAVVAETLDRVNLDQGTFEPAQAPSLRGGSHRHVRQRRDQRASHRSEGNDECAVLEGPFGEDAPGHPGARREGQGGRRAELRIHRSLTLTFRRQLCASPRDRPRWICTNCSSVRRGNSCRTARKTPDAVACVSFGRDEVS